MNLDLVRGLAYRFSDAPAHVAVYPTVRATSGRGRFHLFQGAMRTLIGEGALYEDSPIQAFASAPKGLNRHGEAAVWIRLEDGRWSILCARLG